LKKRKKELSKPDAATKPDEKKEAKVVTKEKVKMSAMK